MKRVTKAKPPHPAKAARAERSPWLPALSIVALTLLAYIPALRATFIWDDDAYLTNNRLILLPGGLEKIWFEPTASPQYYPLVFTTFWIEHKVWDLSPAGHHFVNVLLHAGSALLLWQILLRLAVPGALLAALLFAVHPVQVESVAWITERKNTLSTLFYMAAMLSYLRFGLAGSPPWRSYIPSLILFTCALLSKSVTATWPAAILVILWWKQGRVSIKDVIRLAPFFVLGVAAALHTAWLEQHHVGAEHVEFGLSPLDHVVLAARIVWFYLGKLFWPVPLVFIYPRWSISAADSRQWAFPLSLIVVFLALGLFRRRIGRGPLAAMLLYCGTLVPVLGFVKVYPMLFSYVADHFQYLASAAVIALAATAFWQALQHRAISRAARLGIAAVPLIACVALTWMRTAVYHDEEVLWRTTLDQNPNAWIACSNLGALLRERKQFDEALELCRRAVALNPSHSESHVNVGSILYLTGHREEGLKHLFEAVKLKPESGIAHYSLAGALIGAGRIQEALDQFHQGVARDPDDWDSRVTFARSLWQAGRADLAVVEYADIVRHDPANPLYHNDIAIMLSDLRRTAEAIEHFQIALRLAPADASLHMNFGKVLQSAGRIEEAIAQYREALRLNPGDQEATAGLQRALASPRGS